jgi:hypothetical protein
MAGKEYVTREEIIAKGDAMIEATVPQWKERHPLAAWVQEETEKRRAAEETWASEPVAFVGGTLTVGGWYSVEEKGEYSRKARWHHGLYYRGRRVGKTWKGRVENLEFDAWGAKPRENSYPRFLVIPRSAVLTVKPFTPSDVLVRLHAEREARR